jgi:hypothetical protein
VDAAQLSAEEREAGRRAAACGWKVKQQFNCIEAEQQTKARVREAAEKSPCAAAHDMIVLMTGLYKTVGR